MLWIPRRAEVEGIGGEIPPLQLSEYLCKTVLVKGTAAVGPMLFLSFETISCFVSQRSLNNRKCSNTSWASLFLSFYLAMLTTMAITKKATPMSVQRATARDISALASGEILWWQKLQAVLISISATSTLFLLSVLGAEGKEDVSTFYVGGAGGSGIGAAFLLGSVMQHRILTEHRESISSGNEVRGDVRFRNLSTGELQDGMALGALP